MQVVDLVGGAGGFQHLVEHHAVDRDHGVVAGDDLLLRNLQHVLHHVDPMTDAVDERRDHVQPGLQHLREAAEPLDRVGMPLGHDLDRLDEDDDR